MSNSFYLTMHIISNPMPFCKTALLDEVFDSLPCCFLCAVVEEEDGFAAVFGAEGVGGFGGAFGAVGAGEAAERDDAVIGEGVICLDFDAGAREFLVVGRNVPGGEHESFVAAFGEAGQEDVVLDVIKEADDGDAAADEGVGDGTVADEGDGRSLRGSAWRAGALWRGRSRRASLQGTAWPCARCPRGRARLRRCSSQGCRA